MVPWFLHGLCVAPRLPLMAPVNLGTCNITPKSTVLTTIFGAIVATGAFGPNGEASYVGYAGSVGSAQFCQFCCMGHFLD